MWLCSAQNMLIKRSSPFIKVFHFTKPEDEATTQKMYGNINMKQTSNLILYSHTQYTSVGDCDKKN